MKKNLHMPAHLSERGRKGHCMPHIDLCAVLGQWCNVLIPRGEEKTHKRIDYSALQALVSKNKTHSKEIFFQVHCFECVPR